MVERNNNLKKEIDERLKAEQTLREREVQYRRVFDSVTDGLILADFEGIVLEGNPQACALYGYSPEEIVELKLNDLFQPEYHQRIAGFVFGSGYKGFFQDEVSAKRKDGVSFDVDVRGTKFDYNGTPRLLFIVRDLTERVRLENQLQQAQKMEAIGMLAGGIAHDFNNILTAIIGYSELMKEDLPEEGINRDHLEEVLQAGKRAKEVVGQILMFSRQNENERAPIDIHIIIKEALRLVRSSLPTTIEIRSTVAPCGTILGNATQMHQIIMNLCTNAYHAMGEKGGVLDVELASVDIGAMKTNTGQAVGSDISVGNGFPSLPQGSYVRLSVRDTGHGMAPDVIERVFDPYFTTKPKDQGVGLGLAVVHGIVRKHAGGIRVHSVAGEGTTFDVYLPKAKINSGGSVKAVHFQPVPTGNETILFVDDEPAITEMAKQILERLGYTVTARTNSKEALELFQAAPDSFDVVITDMTMPRLTGDTLASELLKIRPDLPIILCTGFSQQIDEEKSAEFGGSRFSAETIGTKKSGDNGKEGIRSLTVVR